MNNVTNREIFPQTSKWMTNQFLIASTVGEPQNYDIPGVDESTGDYQIDFYPIPNDVWTININMHKRQAELADDTTETAVPSYPIMLRALYSALVERGEDGGLMAAEAYRDFKQSLGDAIAFDDKRSATGTNDWYVSARPPKNHAGYP
jgi:hypothetical protein